jgi:hypothetical protein
MVSQGIAVKRRTGMFTYERHLVVVLVIAVVIIAAAVLAAVLGVPVPFLADL